MKKSIFLLVTSLALIGAVGCSSAQKAEQNQLDSALAAEASSFADIEDTTETASESLEKNDAAAAFTAPDSSYESSSDNLSLGSGSSGLGH